MFSNKLNTHKPLAQNELALNILLTSGDEESYYFNSIQQVLSQQHEFKVTSDKREWVGYPCVTDLHNTTSPGQMQTGNTAYGCMDQDLKIQRSGTPTRHTLHTVLYLFEEMLLKHCIISH